MELTSHVHCYQTCHAFPHMSCAAYVLHSRLMNHFIAKSYIKRPRNHRRYSVMFASGLPKSNSHVTTSLVSAVYKQKTEVTN